MAVAVGDVFGRLTVVGRSAKTDGKNAFWDCMCTCGNSSSTRAQSLTKGETRSCGCLKKENLALLAIARRNPYRQERRLWRGMIARCHNPTRDNFKWYGGRGIKVCSRWRKSFSAFIQDMGKSEGRELDRINNDGHYTPRNCRWVDHITNSNNRRGNRVMECEGRKMTLTQWSRETGINEATIRYRLTDLGWSTKDALTLPVRGHNS